MSTTASLQQLANEALDTGTLSGLPAQHFIDGAWTAPASGATLETFDPGSGRAFARFAAGDAEDVDRAVQAADRALAGPWRRMPPAERGRILARSAARVRDQAARLAVVESLDCGKPLGEAEADVAGVARAFEYYAGACDKLHGDSLPLGPDYLAYTVNEPAGVTAHIIPWNFPISTAARSLAPALATGCTVVAKPAEQTPLTALLLAEILDQAGLPAGVCNVVTGTGSEAGAALVAHPGIHHVTFTGSVDTGSLVMQAAARNITRVTLELGGKSPVVVCRDCDPGAALDGVLGAIYEHAGQVCSAGSRLVIERGFHDEFVEKLARRARDLRLGHGLRNPQLGPICSVEQLDKIAGHVDAARARGVNVLTGGTRSADPETGAGWFYLPTILDRVSPGDAAVQEEIFGPVLSVQVADSPEQALALANGTDYGLVAGIYTRDLERALRFARDIDAGQVFINEYFAGGIEVPFGGNNKSGFGREKGMEALRHYCKIKSVVARI